MSITETRKQNINALTAEYSRGVIADKMGYKDTVYVNQLCGGHADMGSRTARKLEAALSLPSGWMDKAHDTTTDNPDKIRLLEIWELMTDDERSQLLKIGAALAEK